LQTSPIINRNNVSRSFPTKSLSPAHRHTMEAINQTKLAIAAAREKHGRCRLAHAAKCMYYQCNSFDAEQAMLEAEQAMLEAEQAVLEVAGETTRLELMLSKQVNAPLADGTDVTKRVPDDVLELVLLRKLTMAELFQASRVSRRWRLLVGRVSRMWSAMDVKYAKYAAGALELRALSGQATLAAFRRWWCRQTGSGCTLVRWTAPCACGRRRAVRRCRRYNSTRTPFVRWRCRQTGSGCTLDRGTT
jgi:hypothetical protein